MCSSRARSLRVILLVAGVTVLLAACSTQDDSSQGTSSSPSSEARAKSGTAAGPTGGECKPPEAPVPPSGPSAVATTLPAADDGPVVEAVVYPRPDADAELWSQWGQGLVLPDGRFISAIGDHEGINGNSYLFVYEPAEQRLTRFGDVLSQVEHEDGEWGYGKIHAQMVAGPCGEVFLSTYWGTRDDIEYTETYRGDLLLQLDPETLEMRVLGVPAPERGIPTLIGVPSEGLLYGGAVHPVPESEDYDKGGFFAFDIERNEVVFRADDDRLIGFRTILVDADGTAYLAVRDGALVSYDPREEELAEHSEGLPGGGWLRASTMPAPDGTVYGATDEPFTFFALEPDGSIRDLGEARGYTASLALAPDGSRFYYVPDAHGHAHEQNTPLIEVDTETGEQNVIVELNDLVEDEFGLTLGGTYNVALDQDGKTVYIGFNAGEDQDDPWGEIVLVVVHL